MKIGLIGLGRMGNAIAYRLRKGKHAVVAYDRDKDAVKKVKQIGVKAAQSIEDLAKQCGIVWLMVPAGDVVDNSLEELKPHLKAHDIIIDGGNSHFEDTVRRAKSCARKKIYYLDCGTSGGIKGKSIGFSLMVGGNEGAYEKIKPILKSLAAPRGYGYMGPSGAGHYVKMVHNGVEYALLQAYADGFNLLKNGDYKDLDLETIANVWSNGSVIRSWIVDLLSEIFEDGQDFKTISGAIGENKTGLWTMQEAKKYDVPQELLDRALHARSWSRKTGGNYATKLVALLRNKFGGHPVKLKDEKIRRAKKK